MCDDIYAQHFRTPRTIDSLLVYSSFSMLHYMPPLTANDVQRVIARPWVSTEQCHFVQFEWKIRRPLAYAQA